jgi:hypothetical protein
MNNHFYFRIAAFFIFFPQLLSSQALASTDIRINELQENALTQKLWNSKEWLALLHYRKDSGEDSGYLSQVDDQRFFNAEDGKINPQTELLATITSFYSADKIDDKHPQCRFIARLEWLKEKLSDSLSDLPPANCADYKEWRSLIPDDKATLIFPAYHLNSPSSMFGHTLLRLDWADEKNNSDWLSMAVNFGANIRDGDNSLFFAFKGLSGGYPGFFIVTPYFKKIREYNFTEKRDIWEYPLNLTSEETRRMVAHLWELKEIEFDYYFLDENCSYRLLELLEVARPGINLTSQFNFTVIPVDTVRAVNNAGLINDVNYRPSQVTVLENLLNQIESKNHHYIDELSIDASISNSNEFKKLAVAEQKTILNAAYKYLRYKKTKDERDDNSAKNSHALLMALNSYQVEDTISPAPAPEAPENSHQSMRTSINIGERNENKYSDLSFRLSFHSLEDNSEGFLQGAQINMGNFIIRANEDDSVKLQRIDAIDIFSITPRTQLFNPLSWKIYTGMERQLINGKEKLASHVTGGAGYAYQPFKDNQVYALLMARLEYNSVFDRKAEPAIGYHVGTLYHFGFSTARIELSGENFKNNEFRHRSIYSQNIVISRDHSIKLSAIREKQKNIEFSEFNITYQYYFF